MRRKSKIFYLTALLLCCYTTSMAQSIKNAVAHYNEFIRSKSVSGESRSTYNELYRSFEQYWGVLNMNNADFQQAKAGLKKLYPLLSDGVLFYYNLKEYDKVHQFIQAYIDISMHETMQNEALTLAQEYAQFAYMELVESWNTRQYDKVIKYSQAYINSGKAEHRAEAYYRMAKSYELLNNIPQSQHILEQGLVLYPDHVPMLQSIINILGENKSNDTALQRYISKLKSNNPQMNRKNKEALIYIQAQLYERTQNFEQAIEMCKQLREMKPQNLEFARHLSVNYYNAGAIYANKAYSSDASKKETDKYKQKALLYFSSAVKELEAVFYNDPLAIDYAYALAKAYAYIGDTNNLNAINNKIQAIGYSPAVTTERNMQFMAYTSKPKTPNLMASVSQPVTYADNTQPAQPITQPRDNANQATSTPVPTKSDVDIDIPVNKTSNDNTFAIIIANEKYNKVDNVSNAENDGNVFAEYCHKVLGIPNDNITNYRNTTFGELVGAIEYMKRLAAAKRGNCNFIFYYAGHGVTDKKSKSAHLLPVDADGKQMRVCYSLSSLYTEFSAMNANCITVFLDACYSGGTRNVDENGKPEMLFAARGIEIDVDEEDIEGNVVVFSAVSSSQWAWPYVEKKHGMFTYYILKKLKETRGDVTLQELSNYVTKEVSFKAAQKLDQEQTPTVVLGFTMGDKWKNLKLK